MKTATLSRCSIRTIGRRCFLPCAIMFEDLTDELRRYCREHDLPDLSADELACEISGVLDGYESSFIAKPETQERRQELSEAHKWVSDFVRRWEQAEECERHGHTDTGRGVCADCGAFS